jgi:hypothetical protein
LPIGAEVSTINFPKPVLEFDLLFIENRTAADEVCVVNGLLD